MMATILAASIFSASFLTNFSLASDVNKLKVRQIEEEVLFDIKVVFAAKVDSTRVKVWIKNTGMDDVPLSIVSFFDLFFGPKGAFQHVPYNSETLPSWTFKLANDIDKDGRWDPMETLEITISYPYEIDKGDYFVRVVTHTGKCSDIVFSV